MTDDRQPRPAAEGQERDERLESWKEIAAYLRRDVRTVQRWEQTDGLPVHRRQRTHRPIPYAYKAELDAWWTDRSDRGASSPLAEVVPEPATSRRRPLVAVVVLVVAIAGAGAYWSTRSSSPVPGAGSTPRNADAAGTDLAATTAPPATAARSPKSVAVLPFTDLSEGMKYEEFADGMSEEIINRLTTRPGYRVPAPTSTFYFKNRSVPVDDIARALQVAYVVDGSVRKSGATVRVAVRLIRAEHGDVVWSETYDRPWTDVLRVQDDIAGAVTSGLIACIESGVPHTCR